MILVGLFSSNIEISLSNYNRQQSSLNVIRGGIVIFPKLGTPGKHHDIDEVRFFHPAPSFPLYKVCKIYVPGVNTVFRHNGGKDLIIRFVTTSVSVPGSPWMKEETTVTAAERNQRDIDLIRDEIDAIKKIEAESCDGSE